MKLSHVVPATFLFILLLLTSGFGSALPLVLVLIPATRARTAGIAVTVQSVAVRAEFARISSGNIQRGGRCSRKGCQTNFILWVPW
jgi:hypothetical protein